MIREKWTTEGLQVHQDQKNNGQAKTSKVVDLEGNSSCPLNRNSRGKLDVSVPRSEALLIGKMTGKRVSEPSVTFPIDQPPAKSFVGSPCPFLAGGSCSIYAHRPLLCRTLVNLDTSPKLCELVPNATIPVPYLNTTALRAAFTIVTQSEDFADIREWFAP